MAISFTPYSERLEACQYTGGNSADIIAYIDSLYTPGSSYLSGSTIINPMSAVNLNDWIVKTPTVPLAVLSNAAFTARSNAVPAVMVSGSQPTTVAAIGIGGTTTTSITHKPGFADQLYSASAVMQGGLNVLGALEVQSVTPTSGSTVDVVIKNTGLALLGGKVTVIAVHN